jgi:hypothetical protein
MKTSIWFAANIITPGVYPGFINLASIKLNIPDEIITILFLRPFSIY